MELLSVEVVMDMLGVTRRTVTNMIKRGDLIAEYPQTGKRGRPSMMITASSWVNEHGYTNSVGKPFTSESISRILKNEKAKGVIVMGKYHHDFDKKKIVRRSEEELVRIPAPELAYVSEEVFDKVQERLRAKTGNGRGVNAYSDPLSGKIYCGSCGRKLWKHASNGYVNWMCASQVAKGDVECNGTRITTVAIRNIYKKITDNLEVNKGVVKQDIVKWLNELKATLSDTSVNEKIQKDLDKLERKRTKLLEAYLEDFISKDDYKAKYEAIEGQIEEKKKLLVPVEENEDIKVIESVLQNIDDEIDAYVKTLDMEESKVDFLIEHTKRITVLENRDIIIELDLVAGAIIAGKDFLLYVHDTMSFPHGRICYEKIGIRRKFCRSFSDRFRCHQHRGDLEWHREPGLSAGEGGACQARDLLRGEAGQAGNEGRLCGI